MTPTAIPAKYKTQELMQYNAIFDVPDPKFKETVSGNLLKQCFTANFNNNLVCEFSSVEECQAMVAKHNKQVKLVKLLKGEAE